MKKAISLILALVLCLGLCACGSIEQHCEACGKPAEHYTGSTYLCKSCAENLFKIVNEALDE